MRLAPLDIVFLGMMLIVFGIAVLVDFSLLKAAFYIGGLLLVLVFAL